MSDTTWTEPAKLGPEVLKIRQQAELSRLLMCEYATSKGISKEDFAKEAHVDVSVIEDWYLHGFSANFLPVIINALQLSGEEARRLRVTRLPDLDREQLNQHDITEPKRAGLLFRAYISCGGFTTKGASQALGLSERVLYNCISQGIPVEYERQFVDFFKKISNSLPIEAHRWFGDAEAADFLVMCMKERSMETISASNMVGLARIPGWVSPDSPMGGYNRSPRRRG